MKNTSTMSHLTKEYVQHLYERFGELRVLDDIIQHRATDNPPTPILGYPRNEDNVDDYEFFTGKELHQLVDGAVKYFLNSGLKPNAREVVGIFAPSNVDFVVTFFALSRLGYTVLCLSLRLAPVAIINLLKQTRCEIIVHGATTQIFTTISAVSQERTLTGLPIPTRVQYGRSEGPLFVREFDRETETDQIGLVMHSSGSTGLPKPVFLSHKNVLTHPVQGAGMNNFGALPLYHMYGLSTTLQAMYMAKIANLPSASVPMTADTLMRAIEATKPEIFHGVPYALGLLVEHPRGLEYLKSAKIVTAAGARTPDELGDRLVYEGVNIGVVFGTTEAGLLGDTMRRVKGDDSWNYVRIYTNIRKSIYMDPIGDGQYECVYLKSHPGLSPTTANSDDPEPGSWRSKDVFTPHPTIPDVWKYVTRLDDRVTLSNGEKVLPLPIEGRIRQDNLVREAVVVGVDRALPGLLIFRASDDMSDEEFLDAIWPSIADANLRAEAFSQITRDAIIILPSDVEYPRTDKGSIIRAQVYRKFADEIEAMYARLDDEQEGTLRLDVAEIEEFLKSTYEDISGVTLESVDTDFFTAGVDSLKAIQMRRIIQKTLDLNKQRLSSNVIYDQGNVRKLAKYLFTLGQGHINGNGAHAIVEEEDTTLLMKNLITKYSDFGETVQHRAATDKSQILTGATGSLGAHILAQTINSHYITKVYCLVRGSNPLERVLQSLKDRGLELSTKDSVHKIVALSSNFSQPDLGVGKETFEKFKSEVSLIIHLAWPVNFAIRLQSFEPHLAGLRNLLALSLAVHRSEPARLFFASSISTAENTPTPAVIPDEPIENFNHAIDMGYAQSKLVGEHMVLNAARGGARSYILRIGQIVGDKEYGFWNDSEYIPLMIRSALSLRALPALHEKCSWIPVDMLATAILELDRTLRAAPRPGAINSTVPPVIYNMVNPHLFSWAELLEELRAAGLEFETIPYGEWMERLRESASTGNEERNPAVKILDHFEQRYVLSDHASHNGVNGSGVNGSGINRSGGNQVLVLNGGVNGVNGTKAHDSPVSGIIFDTKAMLRDSQVLRQPPNIIKDGYVRKFLSFWLPRWV
ncbi:Iterative polyketide synthase afoE [Talaromyces pinophilus]|nr:Iterative polyketide synthase afoE [Talaromyces pinophilus]